MATMTIGELDLESAAKEAAGNWQEFDCFCWDRSNEIEDADDWTIAYSNHRDSGLLDQSNAEAIQEAMKPFLDEEPCDVTAEHHNHWAVGWIDGYAIRVFRDGMITDAFRCWHDLQSRLAEYPLLDEENYSAKEHEATIVNIADAAWRAGRNYDLPDDWTSEVYRWLWDHDQGEIENRDDRGGYPSEDALRRAFDALDYECLAVE